MNIPMVSLAAFMALIPLNSSAQCTVNNDENVVGDATCTPSVPASECTVIEGTSSADDIDCRGSSHRHEIYADGGNDTVYGSPFDDFIAGGGGMDTIHGGLGDDAIDGGGNNDTIYGEGGDDTLFGGVGSSPASGVGCDPKVPPSAFITVGSSYLTKGGSGDDTIWGGEGDDCIDAGSGDDVVNGGDGNDTLEGGNHSDMLDGGPGIDYIDGSSHTDTCSNGETYIRCEVIDDSGTDCGNGIKEQGEDCDGLDLGGASCGDFSCSEGSLSCSTSCTLDTSFCTGCPICTLDGMCGVGEDCNNCSNDCDGKSTGKPSGRYCCGDGELQFEGEELICEGGNF